MSEKTEYILTQEDQYYYVNGRAVVGPNHGVAEKGLDYAEKDRLTNIAAETDEDGIVSVSGKVNCNFGFVHSPRLQYTSVSCQNMDFIYLADYSCNCYVYNENGSLCPHCMALLYRECGQDTRVLYMPQNAVNTGIKSRMSMRIKDENIRITEDHVEGFIRRAKAKVMCSFGFVHNPQIEIDIENGNRLVKHQCDCYQERDLKEKAGYSSRPDTDVAGACEHCSALYYKVMADGSEVPQGKMA